MYDILIKNAVIYDGTGADAFTGSVAVKGGRIAAVGDAGGTAAHVIDAAGRALTPGFIDPHSHADLSALMYPGMEAYLLQGVTTVVGGNCGHGMAPMGGELYRSAVIDFPLTQAVKPSYFQLVSLLLPRAGAEKAAKELFGIDMRWHSLGEYIDECNSRGLGANIAPLAGYSAIRNAVMGSDCMREATPEELNRLEALVEDCMRQGALGFSTGLDPQYIPGLFATDSETVRMLRVVRRYGGVFASHTFNVGPDGTGGRMEGYEKMLSQALAAGVRANVSHVHLLGMASTGDGALAAARATLAYFSEMRAKGLDLSYDVIPTPVAIDFTIPYFAFFIRPFVLMTGSRRRLAEAFRVEDFRAAVHAIIGAALPGPGRENTRQLFRPALRHAPPRRLAHRQDFYPACLRARCGTAGRHDGHIRRRPGHGGRHGLGGLHRGQRPALCPGHGHALLGRLQLCRGYELHRRCGGARVPQPDERRLRRPLPHPLRRTL